MESGEAKGARSLNGDILNTAWQGRKEHWNLMTQMTRRGKESII